MGRRKQDRGEGQRPLFTELEDAADQRPGTAEAAASALASVRLDGRQRPLEGPGVPASGDEDRDRYTAARIAHWDAVARDLDGHRGLGGGYHRRLAKVFRALVPRGRRVIEIGCGEGDLLAALEPEFGVGVDFSGEMLRRATARHPALHFIRSDAHDLSDLEGEFDAVVLSDLVNDAWDVQAVLEQIRRLARPHTRVVINTYNYLWERPLSAAAHLGWTKPNLPQNWLTRNDVANLLRLAGFEVVRGWNEVLWPLDIPLLAGICNRVLVRIWPLGHLAVANFIVARPAPDVAGRQAEPVVSVIVPARNEAGNVPALLRRIPEMGSATEVVFVEGHSSDDTYGAVEREISAHPERRCKLLRQPGNGKGDAVRAGFAAASGEVLIILDADLAVRPEDLPRFYRALTEGRGELINGVRLVYPMEHRAMRLANLIGNKFFSLAFSWIIGQPVKDTLCGTKALRRREYEAIAANRAHFGDFDPFGDFDLLFGAARLSLKISEVPVRYRDRTYGETNIRRWQHGWLLLKSLVVGARRLRFV